jgi:hypothetical protein
MADDLEVTQRGSVAEWTEKLGKRYGETMPRIMLQAAEVAAGAVRRSVFEAFPGGRGGLARSYTATLLDPGPGGELRSGAMSDLVYARIQDQGGDIYPKDAKALAFPHTKSAEAQSLSARGVGPREFPTDLQLIWPPHWERGWLADVSGSKPVPHYFLSDHEYIPPTHYLDEAARIAEPLIDELVDAELTTELGDVDAGGE